VVDYNAVLNYKGDFQYARLIITFLDNSAVDGSKGQPDNKVRNGLTVEQGTEEEHWTILTGHSAFIPGKGSSMSRD
jgi:hypothetical protein